MSTTLTSMPLEVFAGTTYDIVFSFSDYIYSDYSTAECIFAQDDNIQSIDLSQYGSTDSYQLTIASGVSAQFETGVYNWVIYVSDSTSKYPAARGQVEVFPYLPDNSSGVDTRSHSQRMLDLIETALEAMATGDNASIAGYSISDGNTSRSLSSMSYAELIEARRYYKRLVVAEHKRELQRRGKAFGTRIIM